MPNTVDACFYTDDTPRDIDVLIQRRKSSSYLLNDLAPRLSKTCKVEIVDDWVPSLAHLFRRSKVYLYDSRTYWMDRGVSEGFGLPPLEAMACVSTRLHRVFDRIEAMYEFIHPAQV